jgi:hypothetical protein
VLYADYTPCGPIYTEMKPDIKPLNHSTRRKNADPRSPAVTSNSRLNPDSKIVRRFKSCLNQYEMFYALRTKALEKIKAEANPF